MTPYEEERYSRQIRFQSLGKGGQESLLGSSAAVVGCGALGAFQAGILARAGVGRIRLIDRDYVEVSNLQRQWLFDESDAARALPKAAAAASHLKLINSRCQVETCIADLTARNAEELLSGVDLLLDGTDNFETRYLLNDYSGANAIPWIYGAAVGSYGLVMPILPGRSSCFRCVYPVSPGGIQPTCETAGVLGPLTSLIASLQTTIAIQILSGHSSAVPLRITTVDVWTGAIRQICQPEPDPACRTCGTQEFPDLLSRRPTPISLCGRNAVQIHESSNPIDIASLRDHLQGAGTVLANEFALRLFVGDYQITVFQDGRAIIKGTTDIGVARSLYAQYVGR